MTIVYGSKYTFNSAPVGNQIDVDKLDDDRFVVLYQDQSSIPSLLRVKIGTIVGNSISYSDAYEVDSLAGSETSISVLDSTHFVVVYRKGSSPFTGVAKIGTIFGNTISYSSSYQFGSTYISESNTVALDSTHFVTGFANGASSNYGTVVLGTISGNTISYSSLYSLGEKGWEFSITKLDSSHFGIAYSDSLYQGSIRIGEILGNTIILGSVSKFLSSDMYEVSITSIDNSHILISYDDYNDNEYGKMKIAEITGNEITSYGTSSIFNSASTWNFAVCSLNSTTVVNAFENYTGVNKGYSIESTISGNTIISHGTKILYIDGSQAQTRIAALSETKFVIVFSDGTAPYGGIAVIGELPPLGWSNSIMQLSSSNISKILQLTKSEITSIMETS